MVEWRISFSLVERKIIQNIPEYQRTAYLILKTRIEKIVKEKESTDQSYKSYHLKTVLLELTSSTHYCTDGIHNNAYEFTKSLIERLIEAYEKKSLSNFFFQQQNLLDHEDVLSIKEILINESRSHDMSCGDFFEDPDELWRFQVTVLRSNETITDYIKKEESEIIPQNIMLMLLTEFYHKLVSPKDHINESEDLPRYWIIHIIKIKRIIRLIVLYQQNPATSSLTITSHQIRVFNEILNFPTESGAKYFKEYLSILPKKELPKSRNQIEQAREQLFPRMNEQQIKGKHQIIKLVKRNLGKREFYF